MTADDDKRAAAEAAVAEIVPNMLVGLGTGTTAMRAIEALARRVAAGLVLRTVATSETTASAARALGLSVERMDDVATVDIAIDGADELDDDFRAIKGAGGAMLREKVVAAAAHRMIVIADASKRVPRIGKAKVPVEMPAFARTFVTKRLEMLGAVTALRENEFTDSGNLIVDCRFASIDDPVALAAAIANTPGVAAHGLFLDEVDAAYIANNGIVTRLERVRPHG